MSAAGPHSHVLTNISADNSPLNQLVVTNSFFFINYQNIFSLTPTYCSWESNWMFECWKSVHDWWSYISFAPECKELARMLYPPLYRWDVPPVVIRCVHWTVQRRVLQPWITPKNPSIVMMISIIIISYDTVGNIICLHFSWVDIAWIVIQHISIFKENYIH